MAKELRHKDVVSGAIKENEYEANNQHISDGGADGDIVTVQADETLIAEPVTTAIASHIADPDAHHSEEIPEGRIIYGAITCLSIPGMPIYSNFTALVNSNRLYYFPMYVRTPITVDQVTYEVTGAAGAGEKLRFGIYEADINWQPGDLVVASAELAIDAIAVVDGALASTTLQEGRYLMCLTLEGGATFRMWRSPMRFIGATPNLGANTLPAIFRVGAAYAALNDPGTAYDTIDYGTTGFNMVPWLQVATP